MIHDRADTALLCRQLEETWHREIPITLGMAVRVVGLTDGTLRIAADFDRNRNLHGTAFAGSLYSVCVLAGWGAAWLALRIAGVDAHIVARTAEIRYLRPVKGEIRCRCPIPDLAASGKIQELGDSGRCTLELGCEIVVADRPAAVFRGAYALRLQN